VPGCVQLVDILKDSESLSLVFPYYPLGDLESYIRRVNPDKKVLPEPVAKVVFAQAVKAVMELHKRGIIHRDLKKQNILVEADVEDPTLNETRLTLHLCDFGFSVKTKELLKENKFSQVGTLSYFPYEMVYKENRAVGKDRKIIYGGYDERIDIWTLGVMLYSILYYRYPFDANGGKEAIKARIKKL